MILAAGPGAGGGRAAPLLLGAGLVVLLTGCGGGDREVVLTVRTTLPGGLLEHVEESYEETNPSIDLRFSRADDAASLADLRAAEPAPFDVWWGASALTLQQAGSENLLLPHRPAWVEATDSAAGAPAWHPYLLTTFVIAFSRDALPISRSPVLWDDILHHRWFGEVVALDPERTEEGARFLGSMVVEALREADDPTVAFDWFERLESPIRRWVRSPAEAVRALESGEASLAILPRAEAESARTDGASWLHYRLPADGSPMLVRGVAIVRGTELEEPARDFVDYVGSAEAMAAATRLTGWEPASGEGDAPTLPSGFLTDQPWTGYAVAADTLVAELDGWVSHWGLEIRSR